MGLFESKLNKKGGDSLNSNKVSVEPLTEPVAKPHLLHEKVNKHSVTSGGRKRKRKQKGTHKKHQRKGTRRGH